VTIPHRVGGGGAGFVEEGSVAARAVDVAIECVCSCSWPSCCGAAQHTRGCRCA